LSYWRCQPPSFSRIYQGATNEWQCLEKAPGEKAHGFGSVSTWICSRDAGLSPVEKVPEGGNVFINRSSAEIVAIRLFWHLGSVAKTPLRSRIHLKAWRKRS